MNNYSQYTMPVRQVVTQEYVVVKTIELIRQYVCSHPVGTLIMTSVRRLARAVGRPGSTSAMTKILSQLETDGWLMYTADDRGTIIEVRQSDHVHDQSAPCYVQLDMLDTAAQSPEIQNSTDHAHDRSAPREAPDHAHDRSVCIEEGARVRDPEITMQQQQQHGVPVSFFSTDCPTYCRTGWWQAYIQLDPTFNEPRLSELLKKCASRDNTPHHINSPFGLVKRHLQTGEPILSLAEIRQQAAEVAALFAPDTPAPDTLPATPPRQRPARKAPEQLIASAPQPSGINTPEARQARAANICPNATQNELLCLLEAFDDGLSDAGALAFLSKEREAGHV